MTNIASGRQVAEKYVDSYAESSLFVGGNYD